MNRVQIQQSSGTADATEQKRLRNRRSQQAFRKRQNDYIQELEKRLADVDKTDNERIFQLEKENAFYRKQLGALSSKLAVAQSALQSMSNLMSSTLELDAAFAPDSIQDRTSVSPDEPRLPQSFPLNQQGLEPLPLDDQSQLPQRHSVSRHNWHLDSSGPRDLNFSPTAVMQQPDWASSQDLAGHEGQSSQGNPANILIPTDAQPSDFILGGSIPLGVPGVWSYHYQMGPSTYQAAMESLYNSDIEPRCSNSAISDHIKILHSCIRNTSQAYAPAELSKQNLSKIQLSTSLMLSMFHSLSRPLALSWYTPTKFYFHTTNLTIWQIFRTREAYMQLPLRYRPSALQLSETYPPVIDWCPFPSLRDKLILLHSANPHIDQIICDIATAYVMEADISKLVSIGRSTTGYIRIWDVIQAMGDVSDSGSRGQPCDMSGIAGISNLEEPDVMAMSLPAPSPEALFDNQHYARAAFRLLHMDNGVSRLKIDATFFQKYPELYDDNDGGDMIATGTQLSPVKQTSIPTANPLDKTTVEIYRHFSNWSSNVIFSTSFDP